MYMENVKKMTLKILLYFQDSPFMKFCLLENYIVSITSVDKILK